MHIERSVIIRAPARRVFEIYQNVPGWASWDPDTRQADLDGPFAVGTSGSLTPAKGRTVTIQLTRVEPDVSFTVETRLPLFRMVFEHEIRPEGEAVKVTHRATFSGLLTPVLGRMLVKQLRQGLPVTLANLKRITEAPG